MKKYTIGIDPGSNGGIVVLTEDGIIVEVIKSPETDKDILLALSPYAGSTGLCDTTVWLEKLWGHSQMMGSKSSLFNQGENYGMLKMAVIALELRLEEVVPGRWQKHFGLKRDKTQTPKDWKAELKDRAQKLFPQEKVTLWNSDALLIAKYGHEQTQS